MAYFKALIVILLLVEAESCNGSGGWSSDELAVGDQRKYKGEDIESQCSSTNGL